MDEAALRVAPAGLRLMVRHRQDRENLALAEMQAALGRLVQTETAVVQAARHRDDCLETRIREERGIYDRLASSEEALTPGQLGEQLTALSRLTEAVEAADRELSDAGSAVTIAKAHLEEMRTQYARCARDAAKWVRIEDSATEIRRRDSELRDELEVEDEVSLRHGRRGPEASS